MSNRATIYKSTIDMNNKTSPRVMAIDYMSIASPCVLDVGCACGDLGVALKEIKQATVYGFEYNPDSIKIAQETKSYAEINQLNLDNLTEADFPQYKQNFDYIVCGDVLEHLRYPAETLNILKNYLKDDGYIIASIPNVAHASIKSNLLVDDFTYTPLGLLDETHIHLFTYKSIAEMFSKIGFNKKAWQPNDPYPILSEDIKKFLFDDWHSFVCQYVVKLYPTRDKQEELLIYNLKKLSINEQNSPENIKKYRAQVLCELGELSEHKIANLTSDLSYKEQMISSLNSDIDGLRQNIADKEQNEKALQEEISTQQNTIAEREKSIFELETEVSSLNSDIDGLRQSIIDKEQNEKALQEEISNQQNTIAEKEKNISKLETDVFSLNSNIEWLRQNIADKEQHEKNLLEKITNQQNIIAESEKNISKLKAEVSSLSGDIEGLRQNIMNQDGRIHKFDNKLIRKKRKYKAVIIMLILIIFVLIGFMISI